MDPQNLKIVIILHFQDLNGPHRPSPRILILGPKYYVCEEIPTWYDISEEQDQQLFIKKKTFPTVLTVFRLNFFSSSDLL